MARDARLRETRSTRLRWRGRRHWLRWQVAVRVVAGGVVAALQERLDQINRRREDDRRGARATDLEQRLQVAKLQRDRMLLDHERGILQPLRGLELALRVDDLGAPLALGL